MQSVLCAAMFIETFELCLNIDCFVRKLYILTDAMFIAIAFEVIQV